MVLPAPHLDDRRFQDLVDEAKRMVMQRCPEWTDHNVSDPGVTLIETFAYMTDQLLYRLNRVPDRLYIKFLDLIGVHILPPTPARTNLTFWLSAPARTDHVIPAGTQAATVRTQTEDPITFTTVGDLLIVPASLQHVRIHDATSQQYRAPDKLTGNAGFRAFGASPGPGDELLIGLSETAARCCVRLNFSCRIDGVGVDPTDPPLKWQAWNGEGWTDCAVLSDETGGLNRDGSIVLHLPGRHEVSIIDSQRAGWLRALVTDTEEGQPAYSASPLIQDVSAETIGGSVEAIQADMVQDEVIGISEGVPGQILSVLRTPVLGGSHPAQLKIGSDDGWDDWEQVGSFAASGPEDRHFVLDGYTGTVHFGPAVREPDGTIKQYGAVPAREAVICMHRYATGGGRHGNVAKGAVQTLKSSIPFVARVENLDAAQNGSDGETVEEAKTRGPLLLRARTRAVTAEDYEVLAKGAAPSARVHCLTAGEQGIDAGSVKVLVVPSAASVNGHVRFEDLAPPAELMQRIATRLDQVRLIGVRILVEPPRYQGITVVAGVAARRQADPAEVRAAALDALYHYLNPIVGGPDGTGWPFGRDVQTGEIHALLQRLPGVDMVNEVRLFGANPITGERGLETTRLILEDNSLVYSYQHHVRIEDAR
ncbi:putative baseplate assembly protein [Streptomyces sp. NPDC126514]|uniref:putative baseplate assembly protein n=1 Tax=Streptomyces sp. NPDC126514 TaxID=3155210 RepID=UPI00331C193C